MIIGFILFVVNVTGLILGLWYLKRRLESKAVNREIFDKVKKEINSIMVSLNQATYDNITIIDEKIQSLKNTTESADIKIIELKEKFNDMSKLIDLKKKEIDVAFSDFIPDSTYNPKKIVKQSTKTAEIINEPNLFKKVVFDGETIPEKKISIVEKVNNLYQSGYGVEEIKKMTGLSSGELELLININSMRG